MRISDWSSDVRSSDLRVYRRDAARLKAHVCRFIVCRSTVSGFSTAASLSARTGARRRPAVLLRPRLQRAGPGAPPGRVRLGSRRHHALGGEGGRSEEHTSELQSLMRISYAVFCLKKKTKNNTTSNRPYTTMKIK